MKKKQEVIFHVLVLGKYNRRQCEVQMLQLFSELDCFSLLHFSIVLAFCTSECFRNSKILHKGVAEGLLLF